MNSNEAKENSLVLCKEADRLIKKMMVIETVEKYFNKHLFVGSYAMKTMVWPDIDISILVEPNEKPRFLEMVAEISQKDGVFRALYKDEYVVHSHENGALYCGLQIEMKDLQHKRWKIDIKGLSMNAYAECSKYVCTQQTLLTEENRNTIILLKTLACENIDGFYRPPKAMSYQIHQAVINSDSAFISSFIQGSKLKE